METLPPMKNERLTQEKVGVPAWAPNPFGELLKVLPESEQRSAIRVHDDLEVARAIALSIYGESWKEYVLPVYERFRVQYKEDAAATVD